MNDLLTFIRAVMNQWVFFMSSLVSIALTIVLRVRGKDVSNKIFLSIAAFFLFLACFFAWRVEHISVLETKRELTEEKDKNSPKLAGHIERVVIGMSADSNDPQVLIRLNVINLGTPSIAQDFNLRVHAGNFDDVEEPAEITKTYTLRPVDGSPEVTISQHDAITEKADNPITSGARPQGWLRFVVKGVETDTLRRPDMVYTVSFSDVLGKTYTADYAMTAKGK